MIDEVITRLKDNTGLRTVEGSAALSRLMANKTVPQGTHGAYVVPLGLAATQGDSSVGIFRQMITEEIGVILMRNDWKRHTSADTQDELQADIKETIEGLCGWAPQSATGVFSLRRGQLIDARDALIIYQLTFSIPTQLRIQV